MAASSEARPPCVRGLDVREHTQCAHWHSDRDVIAIKHRCCDTYYACISCHEALAGHENRRWSRDEIEQDVAKAVLCGRCKRELTVAEYLQSDNRCPGCAAAFNPGCRRHYHLYFEVGARGTDADEGCVAGARAWPLG